MWGKKKVEDMLGRRCTKYKGHAARNDALPAIATVFYKHTKRPSATITRFFSYFQLCIYSFLARLRMYIAYTLTTI